MDVFGNSGQINGFHLLAAGLEGDSGSRAGL